MTKGLHKDSLRKGEPNKWIVEDIIEKIRAWVEREKEKQMDIWRDSTSEDALGMALDKISVYNQILSILSDLEKEEKSMNPQPVKIDIRKELASIEFMGVNDARDTETIARHFYALGQQSKEQPVCEDLESYAQRVEDYYDVGEERGYLCTHRGDIKNAVLAGAKWQKEQMMKEAVEGEVVQDLKGVNRVKSFSKIPEWLHFGDKVKLIIVKED